MILLSVVAPLRVVLLLSAHSGNALDTRGLHVAGIVSAAICLATTEIGKLKLIFGYNFEFIIKMFLKPVWEGKMHGVTKIGIFRPLFCVNMLGKSTNYSTGTRPLCSTF